MRITKNAIAVLTVAGLGFTAGRLSLLGDPHQVSGAQSPQEKTQQKPQSPTPTATPTPVDERMQAWARAGTPGEHHKVLDASIGDFDAVVRFRMEPDGEWMESAGTVTREWVLGNRFIRETVEASSAMGPFSAIGYLGYNNYDGQYEIAWMENHSTAILFETGTYDPGKKVMTVRSSHRDPASGRVINGWGSWDMSNPDRQVFTGYATDENGKEFKNFEGFFERTKKQTPQ